MMFKTAALLVVVAVGASCNQEARQSITAANNDFALDLYEVLRREPGNMVVSPFSAATVLALAMTGAGGNTRAEMKSALRLPEDDARIVDGYRQLLDSLQSTDEMILRTANKIYADRSFNVKPSFQQVARDSFLSAAEEVDFRQHTEAARVAINSWVEEITDNKIKDLLSELDPSTAMVLVNAIYFRGTWLRPFYESATRQEPFHVTADTQVQVPMMHRTGDFRYSELPHLNARALELPYLGHKVKMLIILPNAVDGLAHLESNLRQLNISQLSNSLSQHEVVVSLPKFTIESTFQLQEKLPELGMRELFTPLANLSGIAEQSTYVSKVIQKAFVEVNENGTIAAAATAIEIVPMSAVYPPPQEIIFSVDHPFMFILLDDTNTFLFVGRTVQP